ncbi:magnesium transporter [Mycoplasma crocodyli]|uniref:Magnesium transporter MgtE n=1 Tax=Mycoplasma crocodyli (strain ATCC 51981 / MP145) TaxID=512564 RepID=D5E5H8_MYCCM|nr:magnesium transporter [Mycoplasma crocodyli]ADE19742.1 magnesium/cobalt/nickel ion transporter [Mycoplasma crocodyli MP145]
MEEKDEILIEEIILDELKTIISNRSVNDVRDLLDKYTLVDIAEALENVSMEEQLFFFRVLKTKDAAELFSFFDEEKRTKLVHLFTEDWGMKNLQDLQSDELADVLEDLPVNLQKKILNLTPIDKRNLVNSLLSYEEDTVGSIMAVDISTLKNNLTCRNALKKIRNDYKNNAELSHSFYVTDETGVLLGSATLEEIVFADESMLLEDIYSPVAKVSIHDDIEKAAQIFSDHDRSSLPVVNSEDRILGMITSDNIIDVIQDIATEDMYKMAGINPDIAEESYIKTTIKQLVRSRVIWLIVLMISATLSQFIIQKFTVISENFINGLGASLSTAIIVSLIPVISGTAGNAGSQSSTTITRAEALGEIQNRDLKKVLSKEILVGLTIGLILFAINILRLSIYFSITGELLSKNTYLPTIFIIFASSFALLLVIIFAKILGTIIPIVAIKFKKDPAVMSAPILATLSDAISTLIFFGITILTFYLVFVAGWL